MAEIWAARQPNLPLETPDDLVNLASIVERETGVASERPLVAAVFINRLRRADAARDRSDHHLRRVPASSRSLPSTAAWSTREAIAA